MGNQIDPLVSRLFEEAVHKQDIRDKDQIAETKKRKKSSNQLDLHGMTLDSALARVRSRLSVDIYMDHELQIVTGTGIHSPGIFSVLQQGVEQLLEQYQQDGKLTFTQKKGVFTVWIRKV